MISILQMCGYCDFKGSCLDSKHKIITTSDKSSIGCWFPISKQKYIERRIEGRRDFVLEDFLEMSKRMLS